MISTTTVEKICERFGSVVEKLSIRKQARQQAPENGVTRSGFAVLIASGQRNDGRSTVSLGLAVATAALHPAQRVLLVELDHRHPAINRMVSLADNETGITDVIRGKKSLPEAATPTSLKNLHILARGTQPMNPLDDLQSKEFDATMSQLKSQYDYIFLDSPAINEHVDARLLVDFADCSVLVIRSERSKKEEALLAKGYIPSDKLAGAVINDFRNPIPSLIASRL